MSYFGIIQQKFMKIKWRKFFGGWQMLIFFDGMFDYDDVKDFLQIQVVDQNLVEKKGIFVLDFSFIINLDVIIIVKDYKLDFIEGEFISLIGYEKILGLEKYN